MAVSLSKGQKFDLTKQNPGLSAIMCGLGWDANVYDSGGDFDLDASAFLCAASGKVESDDGFVFYNHPKAAGVEHMGDNRTGAGEGDDEVINVDLSAVDPAVEKIAFAVTIDQAEARKQNFGMVSNAYIRICRADTGEELVRYDLGEDYSTETAVVVAELYRHNGEWKFNAVGSGFAGGLAALCGNYGIQVA